MDDQLFKIGIAFEGNEPGNDALTFNFLVLPKGGRMVINPKFLSQLLILARENKNPEYTYTQSIKVAQTGQGTPLARFYMNFYVLFFTKKDNGKKRGIFISFDKDKQGLVSAVWPISFRDDAITSPKLLMDVIHDLSVHPEQYENVNLITTAPIE
nr:hypothetical protein [Candidatus Sigynarchaeota archaeon]